MAQFKKMVDMKPDAFIMADPGLINLVRKEFPDVEIPLCSSKQYELGTGPILERNRNQKNYLES